MPENEAALLTNYLILSAIVFSLGMVGFLARRNIIVMFLSAEMMLQGVSLALVAFSRYHNDWGGQMMVIFIISIAACEAAIALALVLTLFRRAGNLDAMVWQLNREDNQPPVIDLEVPEPVREEQHWPQLTPAGVEPTKNIEDFLHRRHV